MLFDPNRKEGTATKETSAQEALRFTHGHNLSIQAYTKNKLSKYNISPDFIKNLSHFLQEPQKSKASEQIDNPDANFIQSEISTYYINLYKKQITQKLEEQNVPKDEVPHMTQTLLERLAPDFDKKASKAINDFKQDVFIKLFDAGIPEEEFANFWQWRIQNPPATSPKLIHTKTGDKVHYDDFTSLEAIEKFLDISDLQQTENEHKLFGPEELDALGDELTEFANQLAQETN
jgi:hypothetical protein